MNDTNNYLNKDRTQVGVQGGSVTGGVHFNNVIHHTNITTVSAEDPPEKRFRAGVEDLRSGKRSSAERLIGGAVDDGYVTGESVYYWLLAILSKRLFEQLGNADLMALQKAGRLLPGGASASTPETSDDGAHEGADDGPDEGFLAAAGAVLALVWCQVQDESADSRGARWSEIQTRLGALPEQRDSEIRQHLNMLMHRALRDELEAREREEVRRERRAHDRRDRAPKFFIPNPEPLVARVAVPPSRHLPRRVALGASAALLAGGLLWAVAVMAGEGWGGAVLALALWGGGGYALVVFGPRWVWLRQRRLRTSYEHSRFNAQRIDTSGPPEAVRERGVFWSEMYTAADRWFQDQRSEGERRDEWRQARIGPQVALANDLVERYGAPPAVPRPVTGRWPAVRAALRRLSRSKPQGPEPSEAAGRQRFEAFVAQGGNPAPGQDPAAFDYHVVQQDDMTNRQQALGWLIETHAKDVAARWRNGTLRDFERTLRLPLRLLLALVAGTAAAGLGVLLALDVLLTTHPLVVPGVVALAGGGGWLSWRAGYPLVREHFEYHTDREKYAAQLAAETTAREDWVAYLSDRPSDAEMAAWLDYDQRALRMAAFDNYGLTSWEVINTFFLLEAADGCKRARVLNGPPRYSAYVVRLFILTEDGVWYNLWPLDFLIGQEGNRDDETFRYDVIARCRVREVGLYRHDGRRRLVDVEADGALTSGGNERRDLIMHQTVQLELMHGEKIRVLIDNFDRFLDTGLEDEEKLLELAMEISGATDAVRILQAVGGGGKSWFERQRERSRFKLTSLTSLTQDSATALSSAPERPQLTAADREPEP